MRKKVYSIIIFTLVLAFVAIINISNSKKDLPIYSTSAMWLYDTSTPEKAMGISDYAFVAKINKVLKTEYKNSVMLETSLNGKNKTVYDPYTVYEITVIENIKGEIITNKPIELMQYGGLNYDGKSYTLLENSELLIPGNYYILLSNVWPEENILETSEPTRIINLGDNLAATNSVRNITKYKEAYSTQVIPANYETSNIISKNDINYIKNDK